MPSKEMELRHGSSLVGLQVFQIKASHKKILTPYVLGDQVYLHIAKKKKKYKLEFEKEHKAIIV